MSQPPFDSPVAACRTCGAQLAADQRYCLACGSRVSTPRLDFLAEMEAAADAAGAAPGASAAGAAGAAGGAGGAEAPERSAVTSRLDRVGGPMGAAAVVLVALGIGFLIGESGNDPVQAVRQPAPVVNVQGGVGGGAATTPTDTAVTGGSQGATGDGADAGGAGGARATGGGAPRADDAARVQQSVQDIPRAPVEDGAGGDLSRLRAQPTEQATEGAPPRTDNRAAGGGTEAESIG